ncbi:heme-binding protein 1-like [Alosa sapidissima]|uniref:heme-binding protein 1-like n=1 Tax=Alosa sapidissima TaxID=34773 RepID=UPI001C09D8F6|nr:heme-binding protein 1-like [Alosa sapidissima]
MTFQGLLAVWTLCLVCVRGWDAPWFCHGYDCPEFTDIHTNEDFEERFYNASHWITIDVAIPNKEEVKKALWTLYYYSKGENEEKANVDLPWPRIILVEGDGDEKHGSVSWPVPPETHLPKPNDATIKETDIPAGTVYVRSFGGVASEADAYDNVDQLKASLEAAGKSFNPDRFVAAGYDPLIRLFNRHNEVWLFAD